MRENSKEIRPEYYVSKIRKIGGRLLSDYLTLCREIEALNETIIPLFLNIGLCEAEDTETVLQALKGGTNAAKRLFFEKMERKIENGEIKIESLVSEKTLNKGTPEERERLLPGHIHRALTYRFKNILDSHPEAKNFELYYSGRALSICAGALRLSPSGLIVLPGKFIEIYTDFMEAEVSDIHKEHENIAEVINRFFNGQELTEKLFSRFFIFNCGRLEVNPASVNKDSYLCFGKRKPSVVISNSSKDLWGNRAKRRK